MRSGTVLSRRLRRGCLARRSGGGCASFVRCDGRRMPRRSQRQWLEEYRQQRSRAAGHPAAALRLRRPPQRQRAMLRSQIHGNRSLPMRDYPLLLWKLSGRILRQQQESPRQRPPLQELQLLPQPLLLHLLRFGSRRGAALCLWSSWISRHLQPRKSERGLRAAMCAGTNLPHSSRLIDVHLCLLWRSGASFALLWIYFESTLGLLWVYFGSVLGLTIYLCRCGSTTRAS